MKTEKEQKKESEWTKWVSEWVKYLLCDWLIRLGFVKHLNFNSSTHTSIRNGIVYIYAYFVCVNTLTSGRVCVCAPCVCECTRRMKKFLIEIEMNECVNKLVSNTRRHQVETKAKTFHQQHNALALRCWPKCEQRILVYYNAYIKECHTFGIEVY